MISELLAQAGPIITPVSILMGSQALLTAAMAALYRDCRNDRGKLWNHIRDLEDRIGK
jgi:hypothetical protein